MNRLIGEYARRLRLPQTLLVATMLTSSCTSDAAQYMSDWQDSKNYKEVDTESFNITVDLKGSHTVNRAVYGVNNSLATTPYYENNDSFLDIYTKLGAPAYRFPGGTIGNYFDPLIGKYIGYPNMETRDHEEYVKRVEVNNAALERSKPGGVYDYNPMCEFLVQTGADLCLLLNIMGGFSLDDTRIYLEDLKSKGVSPKFIELGNELYFGEYSKPIENIEHYLEICEDFSPLCREIFPTAKLGLVIPSQIYTEENFLGGTGSSSSNRQVVWYDKLMPAQMGAEYDFFDSVIIHLYSSNGMDASTTESEYLPYTDSYRIAMSHSDKKFQSVLNKVSNDFPGKTIWVTEYHVGGFTSNLSAFRLRYSYLGGLLNSSNLLKLFKTPMVELGSWHSLVQWLEFLNPGSQTLLPEDYNFKIKVNHTFFSMFNNAVNRSNKFANATVNNIKGYTATQGKNKGKYNDVDAGVFYNSSSKEYYVVLINKFDNSYTWNMDSLLESLPTNYGRVASVKALSPSSSFDLEKALTLENESECNLRNIAVSDNTIEIDPYSMYVIYIN